MNVSKRRSIYTLCFAFALLFSGNALSSENGPTDPLLPAGLVMEDAFRPGIGPPVGRVDLVQGEVVIIHKGVLRGYRARKGLPLFAGDTIVTLETGQMRFRLNDESTLTLAPETKLVIDRSIYDPAKKTRSSYISMSLGKARFWVKKFTDFKRSVFKVKTPTAVCGVRGSDFIAFVTALRSDFTALERTFLEVLSRAVPDGEPLLIQDFERAIVETTRIWKEEVSPEEIKQLKKLFMTIVETLEEEEKETPQEPPEEVGEVVSDDVLVDAESPGAPEESPDEDIFEKEETSEQEEDFKETGEESAEDVLEEIVREEAAAAAEPEPEPEQEPELPDFPDVPRPTPYAR